MPLTTNSLNLVSKMVSAESSCMRATTKWCPVISIWRLFCVHVSSTHVKGHFASKKLGWLLFLSGYWQIQLNNVDLWRYRRNPYRHLGQEINEWSMCEWSIYATIIKNNFANKIINKLPSIKNYIKISQLLVGNIYLLIAVQSNLYTVVPLL